MMTASDDGNSFFGISSGGRGDRLIDQNKYETRLPATFDEEANRLDYEQSDFCMLCFEQLRR